MVIRPNFNHRHGASPHVHAMLGGLSAASTQIFDDGSTMTTDDYGNTTYTPASSYAYATPQGPFALQSQSQNAPQADTSWWKDVTQLATQALTVKQTYDINQVNIERVKQGKTPLTPAQMQALAPQLNFGLATQTQKMLLYVALGLGGVWLASSLFKHRR